MSNTHRHKLAGKAMRYWRGMRQWYAEGTLWSSALHVWPAFILGPEPMWWRHANSDKDYYQEIERTRRRAEDRATVLDLPPRWPAAHKDRRRWCRGKQGRRHQPELAYYRGFDGRILWTYDRCTVCGRHLRHHYCPMPPDRAVVR